MTVPVYTCPACLVSQAVVPNILGPAPTGIYLSCPRCEAVAIHHPGIEAREVLRTWASVIAETDVQLWARQLERIDPVEACR